MKRKGLVLSALFLMRALALTVGTYADSDGGYISDPSLYWSMSIYDVYFAGRNSHSGHSYAIENYSSYALSSHGSIHIKS